jgi:hypothetical protein
MQISDVQMKRHSPRVMVEGKAFPGKQVDWQGDSAHGGLPRYRPQ